MRMPNSHNKLDNPRSESTPRESHETIGYLLGRAHRLVDLGLKKTLRNIGLTLAEWRTLRALCRKNGLTCKEVAQSTDRTLTEITGARMRLGDKGLIRSEPHAHDGRSTVLFVTPKGRKIFREVKRGVHLPLLERLSGEEVKKLFAILHRLCD